MAFYNAHQVSESPANDNEIFKPFPLSIGLGIGLAVALILWAGLLEGLYALFF